MSDPVSVNLRLVSRGLGVTTEFVEAVVQLLDEGNTIPFIARYRKDQTGGLDEEQIRRIQERLLKARQLAERKQTIIRSIESRGKLTDELKKQILDAHTSKRLEDLYLPYKPKKQTLATTARSRGLEPLALEILEGKVTDLNARAAEFVDAEKDVATVEDALTGARHILAEMFSERIELRQGLREIIQRSGKIVSRRAEGKAGAAATAEIAPVDVEVSEQPPEAAVDTPAISAVEAAPEQTPAPTEPEASPATEDVVTPEPVADEEQPAAPAETAVEEAAEAEATADEAPEGSSGEEGEQGAEGEDAPEPATGEAAGEPTPEEKTPEETAPVPEATVEPTVPTQEPQAETSGETSATAGEEPPKEEAPKSETATKPSVKDEQRAAERRRAKRRKEKERKKRRAQEKKEEAFANYFEYQEDIRKAPHHRVLALNRGERAHVLRIKVESDLNSMQQVTDETCVPADHPQADFLKACAKDALVRLVLPSLEREVRRELTEKAEHHAVSVFAKNLRNLLLQPPVKDRRVLAIDPGLKHGCKMAAVDQFGNVLAHDTVYLVGKAERIEQAKKVVLDLVSKFQLSVIAIGNGTGCRETEDFISKILSEELKDSDMAYVIVNEAGASVYSTSPLGREEFPDYDALLRGAISIGRRLQDPLSELVKISPAHIGVGLYQHDVKAKPLRSSLDDVVESCVNYVGVDVNTASPSLLRYVSGLNQLTARRVYEHRQQNGPFANREQLKEVAGLGQATFVQAAGFLKITSGDNSLDATWIHPESYEVVEKLLAKFELSPEDLQNRDKLKDLAAKAREADTDALAEELGVGVLTLKDILTQLKRPGRDPREDLPKPVFKQGVLKLDDLEPGMELTGTVLNVVDFGAFVDIGMHDSGLVHISQLANRYIREAHDVVAVGDVVRVWVVDVNKDRGRVSLTMIKPGTEQEARPPRRGKGEGERGGEKKEGEGRRRERRPARGEGEKKPRDKEGRPPKGGRRGDRRPPKRRTGPFELKSTKKVESHLSDEQKSGKEAMRSFGDLAQFFGRAPEAEEPKKKSKRDDAKNKKTDKPPKDDAAEQKPTDDQPASSEEKKPNDE